MDSWKFAGANCSNTKDGQIMGSRKLTTAELESVAQLARSWGKIAVRRVFGEQGPGLDVDLAQMEAVAVAAARGVTAGALEAATNLQAQQMGCEHPCPACGHVCGVVNDERTIHVEGGSFQHHEPKCYCPACRRDFFPSTPPA
jgi:hypothetical protein